MEGMVDKRVHDETVMAEIQLTGDLMIAASEHDGPLTQAEVDAVLGIEPSTRPGRLDQYADRSGSG